MRLGTLGAGLVLLTGTACYRKAIDEWHRVDATMPIVGVDTKFVTANSLVSNAVDTGYVNGYTVSASATADGLSGAIKVAVTDADGVVVVQSVIATGTVVGVRVVVAGTNAIILWESLPNAIVAAKFDSTSPAAIGSPVTVTVTAAGLAFDYDAQYIPATGNLAVMWKNAGTSQLNQIFLTPSTMLTSGLTTYAGLTGFTTFSYLGNDFSTNVLYVGHVDPVNGLRSTTFNGATLALVLTTVFDAGSTTAINIAGNRTGAAVRIYFTVTATASYDCVIKFSTGAPATTLFPSLTMASRVLSANGTFYALARYRSTGNSTYFLLDLVQGVAIGKAFADVTFAGDYQSQDQLPNLQAQTATVWITAGLRNTAVATDAGTILTYVGASTIRFTYQDATVGKPVELNGVMHIPGAIPYLYDGATITEEGFPIGPEQSDAPVTAGGGSMTSAAVYTYVYVDEWIDATGGLHRSNPSTPQSVTLGATDTKVTLALPTLRLTRKTGVAKAVYRTLANGDGSQYFKVSSSSSPTANNPLVNRVAFVDTMADSVAVAGEPLYTEGGVLENIAPPGCRTMSVHRGRLLIGNVEGDPDAIWFSKDVQNGFGVAFSDFLVSRITSVQPITAVGSRDSYAIACTANQSWNSITEYPDDTGAGGVLVFQQQSDTTGCATIGMMAGNDQGTMTYAGAKGMWRMSRGLSWDYVGAPIEDDVTTPVAILPVPAQNQVRVVQSGTVLTYESVFGTWAKWSYGAVPSAIVDAIVWSGTPCYLCADGTVVQESPATYQDNANNVQHYAKLSGLNLAGVAGFWRLYATQITGRVLGFGSMTLTIRQTFDVGTANEIQVTKAFSYVASSGSLDVEADPGPNGKCSRFDLEIFDSGNIANTAFTLAGATCLVGTKKGLSKLPPARRAT